uniref:Allophycocyanin beta 18 subunit n=1 Tax=Compsopogon caeruleus TaxID=31354 RepID=A0A1Z1XAZ8_9RHOD|nr:allophycocyanin beta 18 subunit [Compsopogon caeruleus]ARX96040.1 allophycocyanin beta 18 subunit [Compsopogon caeruleus]
MQDAITSIVNKYDLTGKYLDKIAINEISNYFQTGIERIQLTKLINEKTSFFIKEASAQLFSEEPELIRPSGNAYTTRRYAACLRDLEYYLRYATYALIAGNNNILDERVLDGLKDTYNSLCVPIAPTVKGIQLLKEVIINNLQITDLDSKNLICAPFDHMIRSLGENNI